MASASTQNRIESLDVLKGLVMVVMALDHVRDYFHYSANFFEPTDAAVSTLPIFFTRWITHYCAPTFSLLAGVSAYLMGRRKTTPQLSAFLFTRGLWLVFVELLLIDFGWFFDPQFHTILLATLWSLGVSMIFLAGLVYLPRAWVLGISIGAIAGHNALDGVHIEGNYVWAFLHDGGLFPLTDTQSLFLAYPIVPWFAVMALGYGLGPLYGNTTQAAARKRILLQMGYGSIALFLLLTLTNLYGDPEPWVVSNDPARTLMSILDREKYPPSLQYLLMTLGPAFLFLAYFERAKGPITSFLTTFGRVPFFFYILHIYLAHALAMVVAEASGLGWQMYVLPTWPSFIPAMKGTGYALWVVYVVWVLVIAASYPLCRWFDAYKQAHKEKVWLSYL